MTSLNERLILRANISRFDCIIFLACVFPNDTIPLRRSSSSLFELTDYVISSACEILLIFIAETFNLSLELIKEEK